LGLIVFSLCLAVFERAQLVTPEDVTVDKGGVTVPEVNGISSVKTGMDSAFDFADFRHSVAKKNVLLSQLALFLATKSCQLPWRDSISSLLGGRRRRYH
jgi:hypothetical protein